MRRWLFRAAAWLIAALALIFGAAAAVGARTIAVYPGQGFMDSGSFLEDNNNTSRYVLNNGTVWIESGPYYSNYPDGSGTFTGGWPNYPVWSGTSGIWHLSDSGWNYAFHWSYATWAPQTPGSYQLTVLYGGYEYNFVDTDMVWAGTNWGVMWPQSEPRDTLDVLSWSVSGSASPSSLYRGQNLTITANTGSGPALSVAAVTPGGNVALMAGRGGNWSVTVPASWAPGTYSITVKATFSGGSQSTARVSVTVLQPPSVTGSLSPDQVKLGDPVRVTATTAGVTFNSVTATDPDGTVPLASQGNGRWQGQFLEDWATSGTYPITLTAHIQDGGQVTSTVNLVINGTDVYVIPTNVW